MYGIPGYGKKKNTWQDTLGNIIMIIILLLFVIGLCAIKIDAIDDCMNRGHNFGWCVRARQFDTGR